MLPIQEFKPLNNIAIIPARGGSKRIPRKNIRIINGMPLIARTIQNAIKSNLFDQVVVTTEDTEIKSIAEEYGAIVPFLRNSIIADDHTPTVPVVADAILQLGKLGYLAENYCCIYPAAILVNTDDLVQSYSLLLDNLTIDYVVSITKFNYPIQRALEKGMNGRYVLSNPEFLETRSQDLTERWHDAGQFYWGKKKSWVNQISILSSHFSGYEIPSWRVQDLDTEDDWARLEKILLATTT